MGKWKDWELVQKVLNKASSLYGFVTWEKVYTPPYFLMSDIAIAFLSSASSWLKRQEERIQWKKKRAIDDWLIKLHQFPRSGSIPCSGHLEDKDKRWSIPPYTTCCKTRHSKTLMFQFHIRIPINRPRYRSLLKLFKICPPFLSWPVATTTAGIPYSYPNFALPWT